MLNVYKKVFFLSFLIFIFICPFIIQAQIPFQQGVALPGFTETQVQGNSIAKYINAFYKWAVIAIAIFAVLMIVNAGFGMVLNSGNVAKVAEKRDEVFRAIIGLLLALVTIPFLQMINPGLVRLSNLSISSIQKKEMPCTEGFAIDGSQNQALQKCANHCIIELKATVSSNLSGPIFDNGEYQYYCCACGSSGATECEEGYTTIKAQKTYQDYTKTCCQSCFSQNKVVEVNGCYHGGAGTETEFICVKCAETSQGKEGCLQENNLIGSPTVTCVEKLGKGVCLRHNPDPEGLFQCSANIIPGGLDQCEAVCMKTRDACQKRTNPTNMGDCSCHTPNDYSFQCNFVVQGQPCMICETGENYCRTEPNLDLCDCHSTTRYSCYPGSNKCEWMARQ